MSADPRGRALSMRATARKLALHYDTLRKGWRAMVLGQGFPPPYQARPYRWREPALDAWIAEGVARARAELLPRPAAANDHARPPRLATRRAAPPATGQRQALLALQGRRA